MWPREATGSGGPLGVFAPTLVQIPTFELTHDGDFEAVDDLAAFATTTTSDAQTAIRERAPPGPRTRTLLDEALHAADTAFAPDVIENEVAENYELETAMWIGATLQQGMHYDLSPPSPCRAYRKS